MIKVRRVRLLGVALFALATACTQSTSAAVPPTSSSAATAPAKLSSPRPAKHQRPAAEKVADPSNPVTPGFTPGSVAFWDAENGLLAGQITLYRNRSQYDGAVAVTHDGGSSWHLVYRADAPVGDLATVGDGMAFATVGADHPRLIATSDQAKTWRTWPGSQGLSQASFESSSLGWARSRKGLVRWSSGRWSPISNPCKGTIIDLSFPEGGGGIGWLACAFEPGAGQEPKVIYETDNGGSSWTIRSGYPNGFTSSSKEYGSGLDSYGYLAGISFLPDGSGWLVTGRGTFLSTEDGGVTWQPHVGFQEPEVAFGAAVWRVDGGTGFAIEDRHGRHAVLHVSHDGGATWSRVIAFPMHP